MDFPWSISDIVRQCLGIHIQSTVTECRVVVLLCLTWVSQHSTLGQSECVRASVDISVARSFSNWRVYRAGNTITLPQFHLIIYLTFG